MGKVFCYSALLSHVNCLTPINRLKPIRGRMKSLGLTAGYGGKWFSPSHSKPQRRESSSSQPVGLSRKDKVSLSLSLPLSLGLSLALSLHDWRTDWLCAIPALTYAESKGKREHTIKKLHISDWSSVLRSWMNQCLQYLVVSKQCSCQMIESTDLPPFPQRVT